MGKDRTAQTGNAILVLVAMALGVLIGLMCSDTFGRRTPSTLLQGKMDEVLGLVDEEYVDSVNIDSLSEKLVAVLLNELDPHSTYLPPRLAEEKAEEMRGNFEGVGLMIRREGDTSYVGQVIPDGPSCGSGLLPGDMLLAIDGDTVIGLPSDEVVARLRGARGSRVEVAVARCSASATGSESLTFRLRRGVVFQPSLPYFDMLDDTTGYIMLTSFTETSHTEFRAALRQLKDRGMRHLIFDLRGNGGGSLQSAVGICSELLPQGSLIMYTQGLHVKRRNAVSHGGLYTHGRVTVLIDEESASASEVVGGALQDNDRALIVGRRSFGKGLVQGSYQLKDGSTVLLTTARYYTPSGRCIQRSYDDGTEEYYREYVQRLIDETYSDSTVASIKDSTPYYTAGGRTVYGGGGIIPDSIFPYRHDPSFVYYNQLTSLGLIALVPFDYVKGHAAELLEHYPDADAFCAGFRVPETLIEEVVRRGERQNVKRDAASLRAQRRLMVNRIKAQIGKALYDDATFYRIMLQEDEDVLKIMKQGNKN